MVEVTDDCIVDKLAPVNGHDNPVTNITDLSRKRALSAESGEWCGTKKMKNDPTCRSVNDRTLNQLMSVSSKATEEVVNTPCMSDSDQAGNSNISEVNEQIERLNIVKAISILSEQMLKQFEGLSQRINDLETSLENRLLTKFNDIVEDKVAQAKQEFEQEVHGAKDSVKTMESSYAEVLKCAGKEDISLNIVIRNLPETTNENNEELLQKVNRLIKEGLKLQSTEIGTADRKRAAREGNYGVVIASCVNKEQKDKIMSAKSALQKFKRYERVYIEHDRSIEERLNIANMKTLVKNLGSDRLVVKGKRIVHRDNAGGQNRRDKYEDRRYRGNSEDSRGSRSQQSSENKENRRSPAQNSTSQNYINPQRAPHSVHENTRRWQSGNRREGFDSRNMSVPGHQGRPRM